MRLGLGEAGLGREALARQPNEPRVLDGPLRRRLLQLLAGELQLGTRPSAPQRTGQDLVVPHDTALLAAARLLKVLVVACARRSSGGSRGVGAGRHEGQAEGMDSGAGAHHLLA